MSELVSAPSLYAEAVHAVRSASCTGHDSHRVGRSTTTRALVTVAGTALAGVGAALFSMGPRLMAVPLGLALGLVYLGGIGCWIRDDEIRTTFWGLGHTAHLAAVTRVTVGDVTGFQQLRLYIGARRVASVPLVGPRAAKPDVRAHLIGWLNRPDVAWEPAAQAALGIAADELRGREEQARDLPAVHANVGPIVGAYAGCVMVFGGIGGLVLALESARALAAGLVLTFASVALGVQLMRVSVNAGPSGLTIRSLRRTNTRSWPDVLTVSVETGPWWASSRFPTVRVTITTRHGHVLRPAALIRPVGDAKIDELTEYVSAYGVSTSEKD